MIPPNDVNNNDLVTLEPNVSGGSGDFSYFWGESNLSTPTLDIIFDLNNGNNQQFPFTIIDNCTLESSEGFLS